MRYLSRVSAFLSATILTIFFIFGKSLLLQKGLAGYPIHSLTPKFTPALEALILGEGLHVYKVGMTTCWEILSYVFFVML